MTTRLEPFVRLLFAAFPWATDRDAVWIPDANPRRGDSGPPWDVVTAVPLGNDVFLAFSVSDADGIWSIRLVGTVRRPPPKVRTLRLFVDDPDAHGEIAAWAEEVRATDWAKEPAFFPVILRSPLKLVRPPRVRPELIPMYRSNGATNLLVAAPSLRAVWLHDAEQIPWWSEVVPDNLAVEGMLATSVRADTLTPAFHIGGAREGDAP